MAQVVLGLASSHGPQLGMPPEVWSSRGDWDRRNPQLWFGGRPYAFPELAEVRAGEHLERELSPEKATTRFDACQRAIASLAETLERVAPDVAIIIGDDQHEAFLDDNMPAFSIYWGDTIDTCPPSQGDGYRELGTTTSWGRFPEQRITNPCDGALGRHLIEFLVREGFDPGSSKQLPAGRHGDHGLGHAFSYVYRRLMNDRVIPNVPIFLNTYFPPNQPRSPAAESWGRRFVERSRPGTETSGWPSSRLVG